MRRILSLPPCRRDVRENEILPPWYYGYAYMLPNEPSAVWYPVPLHFVMRLAWMLHEGWRQFRMWGWEDDRARAWRLKYVMYREGYHVGFHDGHLSGEVEGFARGLAAGQGHREAGQS